jgi:hypothetical protein
LGERVVRSSFEGVGGEGVEGEASVGEGLLEHFEVVGGEVGAFEPVGGFGFEFHGLAGEAGGDGKHSGQGRLRILLQFGDER